MKKLLAALIPCALFALPALAQATCPNQSATVSIPLTGAASMIMYDQSCVALVGTDFIAYDNPTFQHPFNSSTSPGVTFDSVGVNFVANAANRGTVTPMVLKHAPSGKTYAITTTVGQPVTSVVGGTTTP